MIRLAVAWMCISWRGLYLPCFFGVFFSVVVELHASYYSKYVLAKYVCCKRIIFFTNFLLYIYIKVALYTIINSSSFISTLQDKSQYKPHRSNHNISMHLLHRSIPCRRRRTRSSTSCTRTSSIRSRRIRTRSARARTCICTYSRTCACSGTSRGSHHICRRGILIRLDISMTAFNVIIFAGALVKTEQVAVCFLVACLAARAFEVGAFAAGVDSLCFIAGTEGVGVGRVRAASVDLEYMH